MLMGLIALVILVAVAFFTLGWWSRHGEHAVPGVIDTASMPHLAPCAAAPNCVCSEGDGGTDAAHWAAPITWPAGLAPEQRETLLRTTIVQLGGEIVVASADYVHATFTSGVFGFVDDVELRLTDTVLQIRSASRVGYSDGGVNRKRVEALRGALDAGIR